MIERVILLSGPISSGKSELARGLSSRPGAVVFKTRDVLRERMRSRLTADRKKLQRAGERLDKTTGGAWVVDELESWLIGHPETTDVVVDSVRIRGQANALRRAFGAKVVHVHLTAPLQELERRYRRRPQSQKKGAKNYAEARNDPTEQQVESLQDVADVVIDTDRCTVEDVLLRATCFLARPNGGGGGYVDVVVGGQYGSEGKGQIAAYLSTEYGLLVRVGGPNAGHKVYEEPDPYTHHQLPSGTRRSQARLLIGPGATIRVPKLLEEIADCSVEAERLFIDPQAMVISTADIRNEKNGKLAIGSTGQGVGAAMARRIRGRFYKSPPIMARDVAELGPYIRSAVDVLGEAYLAGEKILLEGTQGTGLSLYHGSYPHVTSRDTTVSGCLAEAGIAWDRIRRAVMVCRTYPIRVQNPQGGSSGYMSQPTDWAEISRRCNISYRKLLKAERTSTTHRRRRVAEFDWLLLRKAALLNGPTDIALTFADYLCEENQRAKRFDQLHQGTINFIEEIERVTGAPVSLVSTGFSDRSIIDRRRW